MASDEITNALKLLTKMYAEASLALLDQSEHVLALQDVVFALDSRAQAIFNKQFALKHAANAERREALQRMLQESRIEFPGRPN